MDGLQPSGQPFMQESQWKPMEHRGHEHVLSPGANDAAESMNMQYNGREFDQTELDGEN